MAGRAVAQSGDQEKPVTADEAEPHPGVAPGVCEVGHDRFLPVRKLGAPMWRRAIMRRTGSATRLQGRGLPGERCARRTEGSSSEPKGVPAISRDAQASAYATKRLARSDGHRRKPGTGGFTSYEFELHLAHLLCSSAFVGCIVPEEEPPRTTPTCDERAGASESGVLTSQAAQTSSSAALTIEIGVFVCSR
jgi:hypothetical protein